MQWVYLEERYSHSGTIFDPMNIFFCIMHEMNLYLPPPSIKYALYIGNIVVNIQFLKQAVFRRLVDLDRLVLKSSCFRNYLLLLLLHPRMWLCEIC